MASMDEASKSSDTIVLLGKEVQSTCEIDVSEQTDSRTPWITGIAVMPNGYVLLCDQDNKKLKLLDRYFAVKQSLKVSDPLDVSVVDDNNVIITSPDVKQLIYVQVFPVLRAGRVLQLDAKCWGVALADNKIFVTCHPGIHTTGEAEIRILDFYGNKQKQLYMNQNGSSMFSMPNYISVSSSGEKFFVSDCKTHTVTCMSVDGTEIYTHKDNNLWFPRGLLCDGGGNIFVCGGMSQIVQVITADGKKYETLLSLKDGRNFPYAIAYSRLHHTLIVSNDSSEKLLLSKFDSNNIDIVDLLGRTGQSMTEVNVKESNDSYSASITGIAVMSNGYIVLCDRINKSIKLLNSSWILQGRLPFTTYPRDVTVVDEKKVIITRPEVKQLQYIQVFPGFKTGQVLQLDQECLGVAVAVGKIFTTCIRNTDQGEVIILDFDGNTLRRLGINDDGSLIFKLPHYISVSSSGEKVFVSDWETDTITCMTGNNQVIYTYKNSDLSGPRGILCDGGCNIVCVSGFSNCVQVITADGRMYEKLLSSKDGLKNPFAIAYSKRGNSFIIGCWESDTILVYKLNST